MEYIINPIAYIYNNFKEKFGIPRQSGLSNSDVSSIVFEKEFSDENAIRGLDGFSHIWILWIFNEKNSDKEWSATVRPPRLGGNTRKGVFATRSPYHPNSIGLSCVKIESITKTSDNLIQINVLGADLMDGTPIIDIKPYLAFTDSKRDAVCGFAEDVFEHSLNVGFCVDTNSFDENLIQQIIEILSQDPRPSYQNDSNRVYSMKYSDYDISFKVDGDNLFVTDINMNGSEE